jgi:aminoglycoside phosphotransferase (APT) family kinase protein
MTEIALVQFKQAILAHYPDLRIESISFLGEGWANQLCLVNKTLIFRFPLDSNSERQLLREIRLLPVLSPELPLPIPEYNYIVLSSEKYPFAFVGYERIPGESIPQPSHTLRQATWWRAQAGVFLTALHRIPIQSTSSGVGRLCHCSSVARGSGGEARALRTVCVPFADNGPM